MDYVGLRRIQAEIEDAVAWFDLHNNHFPYPERMYDARDAVIGFQCPCGAKLLKR